MKDLIITSRATVYQNDELPEEYRSLVDVAKRQTERSYSPYSQFRVGAAARLTDGTIVGGSNQENAAYPSGLCAERTTLFYTHSQYPGKPVEALAIACYTNGGFTPEPGSPCGACRQVMVEFEHVDKQDMKVILYGANHTFVFEKARDLMPLVFVPESLHDGVEC